MTGYHYLDGYTAGTNLGPTHGVRFEMNNEFWNYGNGYTVFWLPIQSKFNRYAPARCTDLRRLPYWRCRSRVRVARRPSFFAAGQAFEAFAARLG